MSVFIPSTRDQCLHFPPALPRPRYDILMRLITLTLTLALGCAPLSAADEKSKTAERLADAATLFSEVMGTPDRSIPQDLLDKSYCVVLVPGLKKAAFVVGAKFGRGFSVCRNPNGPGWGPPAAIRIEGGSAAAGPVGRSTTAQTDALMNAEILSWSRSRGVFAGISLDGATLRNDIDENQAMYGQRWESKQILGSGAKPPAMSEKLLATLNKYSSRRTH